MRKTINIINTLKHLRTFQSPKFQVREDRGIPEVRQRVSAAPAGTEPEDGAAVPPALYGAHVIYVGGHRACEDVALPSITELVGWPGGEGRGVRLVVQNLEGPLLALAKADL